jgi:hypothetical protein
MSHLIVPDVAKLRRATAILTGTGTHYRMKLFKNNATVDHSTVLAGLTEANFSGYTAGGIVLSGGAVSGALDGTGRAVTSYSFCTWTKSGATGNDIYGYWYEDAAGNLTGVEKFDASQPMQTDGAILQLSPQDTEASQFSNT